MSTRRVLKAKQQSQQNNQQQYWRVKPRVWSFSWSAFVSLSVECSMGWESLASLDPGTVLDKTVIDQLIEEYDLDLSQSRCTADNPSSHEISEFHTVRRKLLIHTQTRCEARVSGWELNHTLNTAMKQVLVLLLLNHISIHVLCLKDIYIVGLCKKKNVWNIHL